MIGRVQNIVPMVGDGIHPYGVEMASLEHIRHRITKTAPNCQFRAVINPPLPRQTIARAREAVNVNSTGISKAFIEAEP